VPADRDATIKKAEKLRKQGKLAGAITEYARLLADRPDDWATINTLGDLHAEAGERDNAIIQFRRVADHLFDEGFHPRAAAVYKKILKVRADNDHALSRLATITERQRLPLEAKGYLERLMAARNGRRDEIGAAECLVRLAALDPPSETFRGPRGVGAPPVGTVETVAVANDDAIVVPPIEEDLETVLADAEQAVSPVPTEAVPEPHAPALEDVFGEMRARVGGDLEARAREQYDRAIRYLEEGRAAEAIANLEEAARTPFVRFAAATRLGRLHVERGELAAAVDWMERAAEVPPPTPDEGTGLLYDLADTLVQLGERERALAILMEIAAGAGEFRDVKERIARLSAAGDEGEDT